MMQTELIRYMIENTYVGDKRMQFRGLGSKLMGAWLVVVIAFVPLTMIFAGIIGGVTGFIAGVSGAAMEEIATIASISGTIFGYMAAGLPPTGLASFLAQPQVQQSSRGMLAIIGTHPNPEDRIPLLARRSEPPMASRADRVNIDA